MCGEWGFSKRKCSAQLSGAADVWRVRLSGIPLKVLLSDELVAFLTSHLTKMTVTLFDPPFPKTPAIRKLHGSVF